MKISIFLTAASMIVAGTSAMAQDVTEGEKDFKKCRACHGIVNGDDIIFKGGKTGPNLYGIVGRTAGTAEGFKFGASMIAAGEAGLVWTEELMVNYIIDPKTFLKETLDDSSAKSKMTFKMKTPEDVVAYLASVSPE